jgi:hypothetical protein
MTAGVNAASIDAKSREDALSYNISPIHYYADLIGRVARHAKVVILTNPVEQTAKLFQEFSGLPPENIVASGVGLDSIRYSLEIKSRLAALGIFCEVGAIVIGQHGKYGMIFPRELIKINSNPADYYIESGVIDKFRWEEILNESEQETRNKGMNLINKNHGTGASETPALAAANAGIRFLFGDEGIQNLPLGIFDKNFGCYIGMPVRFQKEKSSSSEARSHFVPVIDEEVISIITEENNKSLALVAADLVDRRRQMEEAPLDMLRPSQLMNEALIETRKGLLNTITNLTSIDYSSIELLEKSKPQLWKIFEIKSEGKDFSIGVNKTCSQVKVQMLEYMTLILKKYLPPEQNIEVVNDRLVFPNFDLLSRIMPNKVPSPTIRSSTESISQFSKTVEDSHKNSKVSAK